MGVGAVLVGRGVPVGTQGPEHLSVSEESLTQRMSAWCTMSKRASAPFPMRTTVIFFVPLSSRLVAVRIARAVSKKLCRSLVVKPVSPCTQSFHTTGRYVLQNSLAVPIPHTVNPSMSIDMHSNPNATSSLHFNAAGASLGLCGPSILTPGRKASMSFPEDWCS